MLSPAANERRKWDASGEKAGLLTDNKNDEKNKMMLIRVLFCRWLTNYGKKCRTKISGNTDKQREIY
jgi:hypothetical protein